jgi:hypothetical protein
MLLMLVGRVGYHEPWQDLLKVTQNINDITRLL